MKNLLVPIIVFAVILLGYCVYHDSEMKKKNEVNQLMNDADQSLNIVNSYPDNFMSYNNKVVGIVQSAERWIVESNKI